jgi:hypothetical protein
VKDYCTSVDFLFPSDHGSGKPYHSEAAFEKLGELAKCLRQGNQATSDWLFNEGF